MFIRNNVCLPELVYILFKILGKSLVTKERVIRAKNQRRDVTLVSLGSCTSFGFPMDFSLIYDIMTRSEMKKLGIKNDILL